MKCEELFHEMMTKNNVKRFTGRVFIQRLEGENGISLIIDDDKVATSSTPALLEKILSEHTETNKFMCPICGEVFETIYIEPLSRQQGCSNCFPEILNRVYGRENWDVLIFKDKDKYQDTCACFEENFEACIDFYEDNNETSWDGIIGLEDSRGYYSGFDTESYEDVETRRREMFYRGELFIKTSAFKKAANKYIKAIWPDCKTLKNKLPIGFIKGFIFTCREIAKDLELEWTRIDLQFIYTIDEYHGDFI